MIRLVSTSMAALMMTSGFAAAGGIADPAPPPAVMAPVDEPFEGFYVGLGFGHIGGSGSETIPSSVTAPLVNPLDIENDGVHTIFAGYNFQNGNLVYGPEVAAWSVNATLSGPTELNRLADIRGRLGWAAGDALFYGALGWSWGQYENTASGFEVDLDGHNIGIGVEYNVSESLFVGVDYTRRSLEGSSPSLDVELDVDTFALRGGFRF